MAARRLTDEPGAKARAERAPGAKGRRDRYRRLPTGSHGLAPETVQEDQRRRLRAAMVELIAENGYPAVRISDLAKLAHVSPPTFYDLYAGKQALFLDAYQEIATRTARTVLDAYDAAGHHGERLAAALGAFAKLAVAEPDAVSLLVLGALGAGRDALRERRTILSQLEERILASRDGESHDAPGDFTVKAILGGIREVTAARLREGRHRELPELEGQLATWAASYPRVLPAEVAAPAPEPHEERDQATPAAVPSERARRAEGRLPSGRSELPRGFVVKSQQERIVDATAAIVAEKGLEALTISEISRRACVSNETFYAIYPSKDEAFLGAQKVGMYQALQVTSRAYEEHREDWPRAVGAGILALLRFLASEPAHARLTLVDTFGASPDAMKIRASALAAFSAHLQPGFELAKASEGEQPTGLTAEAIAGGVWQVLHHYTDNDWTESLPSLAPQLTYFALTPFLGAARALESASAVLE